MKKKKFLILIYWPQIKENKVLQMQFERSRFSQADLAESDFSKTRFNKTNLSKSDFRGALNYIIDPVGNKVQGARFSLLEAEGLLTGLGVIID